MRDKRPVDELTIEELERILAVRKREERQKQRDRMKRSGRVIGKADESQTEVPVETVMTSPQPASAMTLPSQTVTLPATAVTTRRELAPRFEDEPTEINIGSKSKQASNSAWKNFVNRSMLAVEVFAVVGLIFLGVNLFDAIVKLQDETAAVQAAGDEIIRAGIPTIAPTPQLRLDTVVLPGGHKANGEFNYDEIPAHLLPQVQSLVQQPVISRPPQTDETPLTLIIPDLGVDGTVFQGVDEEALKLGVGQLLNGVTPADERGNLVFAAHNDIYGEIFRHLDQLEMGDTIQVQTRTKVYTYTIVGKEFVKPNDVHVLDQTNSPTMTLISCYPYQVNNQRIIIRAERVDV